MSLLEQCLAHVTSRTVSGRTSPRLPPLESRHDKDNNDEGEKPVASEEVVAFLLEANQLLRQRLQTLRTTLQDQQEGIAPGPDTGSTNASRIKTTPTTPAKVSIGSPPPSAPSVAASAAVCKLPCPNTSPVSRTPCVIIKTRSHRPIKTEVIACFSPLFDDMPNVSKYVLYIILGRAMGMRVHTIEGSYCHVIGDANTVYPLGTTRACET